MMFKDVAINSAKLYYKFLTDEGRGITSCRVKRIENKGDHVLLTLNGKLAIADNLQIKIDFTVYSPMQIIPYEYSKQHRTLKVRASGNYREILENASAERITVISDLRFLVRRVEDWYNQYGTQIQLPRSNPEILYSDLPELHDTPSDDQKTAITGALSSPFTYIWGAPGTGKTKFVLARCVLMYIQAGKKVLITAPTNNAVEQTLYGVLSVLEKARVPLKNVLRLGVASAEFVERYPTVCEDAAIAKLLTEISTRITNTQNLIDENEEQIKLIREAARYNEFKSHFAECTGAIPLLFGQLQFLLRQNADTENNITISRGKSRLIKEDLRRIKAQYAKAAYSVGELTAKVEKYGKKIWQALMPGRYARFVDELHNALKTVDSLSAEDEKTTALLEQNDSVIKQQILDYAQLQAKICSCRQQLDKITAFWRELNATVCAEITNDTAEAVHKRIDEMFARESERLKTVETKYAEIQGLTEQELFEKGQVLNDELAQYAHEKELAESKGSGARVAKCNVLAATVDTCLSRVLPNGDYRPDHVFLDEAGYCSLIKAVTLTAYRCPLTFLGDHMQLPPVCEMNNEDLATERYTPVTLWAQSALFTEDALTKDSENVFMGYLTNEQATFQQMKKYDLIHTYRFGESLAKILSSEVYGQDFHGEQDHDTDIFVIHATKPENSPKRTSKSECDAILEYLQTSGESDVGIITPYRAQRDKLKAAFRNDNDLADSVMTVHGSQGREWDVVLLSVVDTTDKWFTDSLIKKSNGKHVINTAVSRAKKKLILVCDSDYWKTQDKQLIGKLLSVAKEF